MRFPIIILKLITLSLNNNFKKSRPWLRTKTRATNSDKPPCASKSASTPIYSHTAAVPRPVSGNLLDDMRDYIMRAQRQRPSGAEKNKTKDII
jgi:hypothetical protein